MAVSSREWKPRIDNRRKSSLREIVLKKCKLSVRLKWMIFNSFSEKRQQLGNWKWNGISLIKSLGLTFRRGLHLSTNFLNKAQSHSKITQFFLFFFLHLCLKSCKCVVLFNVPHQSKHILRLTLFCLQVMNNLHVVFTMNPSDEGLKSRAATSPALFNRFVISTLLKFFLPSDLLKWNDRCRVAGKVTCRALTLIIETPAVTLHANRFLQLVLHFCTVITTKQDAQWKVWFLKKLSCCIGGEVKQLKFSVKRVYNAQIFTPNRLQGSRFKR